MFCHGYVMDKNPSFKIFWEKQSQLSFIDYHFSLCHHYLFQEPNIVSQVAFILHGIADNLTDNNLTLAHNAVQALIEICTGNHQNQELAFNGQILSSVNSILKENCISITVNTLFVNGWMKG